MKGKAAYACLLLKTSPSAAKALLSPQACDILPGDARSEADRGAAWAPGRGEGGAAARGRPRTDVCLQPGQPRGHKQPPPPPGRRPPRRLCVGAGLSPARTAVCACGPGEGRLRV